MLWSQRCGLFLLVWRATNQRRWHTDESWQFPFYSILDIFLCFFPNLVFECTFCFWNGTVVRVLAWAQLETRMQARSSYFSPFAEPFQHSQTICWHISCSQVKCSHLTTVHTSPGSNFYGLPLFSILVWGFNIFWCHHKRRPSHFNFGD